MSGEQFHSRYRTVPASLLIETLGQSLQAIMDADEATDADLGAVLGKSKWRAAAYRAGGGDMGVVSFLRGIRQWDGRFANAVLNLVGFRLIPLENARGNDRESLSAMAALLHKIADALENDGEIDDAELDGMSQQLEQVGKHVDRLRSRKALKLIASN